MVIIKSCASQFHQIFLLKKKTEKILDFRQYVTPKSPKQDPTFCSCIYISKPPEVNLQRNTIKYSQINSLKY